MSKLINNIPYTYNNCPIPGGGYVTGFVFHDEYKDILYARTDIGGIYRFDFSTKRWNSLCDHVTPEDLAQTYPLSIAIDSSNPDVLFSACGNKQNNYLSISTDGGKTFVDKPLPCEVHGNEVGRSTGERLRYKNAVVWFASQSRGLFKSADMGEKWEGVNVNGEKNLTFVWISPNNEVILVGTNGEVNSPDGVHRGDTLYCSQDNGKSFKAVKAPQGYIDERCDYVGFVPQKVAFDGRYVYVTFSQSGKVVWGKMGAYSCDTGSAFDGRVFRYEIKNGRLEFDKNITPVDEVYGDDNSQRKIVGGYCAAECADGVLYISTICRRNGDIIYRSFDNGEGWEKILHGLDVGKIDWTVSYMKPEYSGNSSCIHWISDFKVSPFNRDFAVFNTGTGAFYTENLTDEVVKFAPLCDGMEETVHLNVYSPNSGDVQVIDIIGDLGGFAFTDVDTQCENSFDDGNGNRYITCLNADFTDTNPTYVAVTPRGNWTGKTKGGVIVSADQCKTWKLLPYPLGITDEIDKTIEQMKKPNVDSGWVAMSADSKRIVWSLSQKWSFRAEMTVYTDNEGESWAKSKFVDLNGREISPERGVKIFADRVDSDVFYAVSGDYIIFVSTNKGADFRQMNTDIQIPTALRQKHEIRCENRKFGRILIANGIDGLYLVEYSKETDGVTVKNLLGEGEYSRCVGFGKGLSGEVPAIFTAGKIQGSYGFFRSLDYGESWQRINTATQQFGDAICMCGDPRRFGRVYIGTGSRGLLYGDEG